MKRDISFLNVIKIILLLAFISLCALSYNPYVYSISKELVNAGEAVVSPYANYITIFLISLIILSFIKTEIPIINKDLSKYIIIIIIILFFSLLINVISPYKKVLGDIKSLLTCMGAFFVGWHLYLREGIIKRILIYYGIIVCVVGLLQIIENIGGFVILASYETDGKNALGAMLAVANVAFISLANSKETGKVERVVLIIMFVFSLVELLTIRARAATLSAVIVAFIVFYFSNKIKKKKLFIFLPIFIILIFLLPSYIYDFIYNSFLLNKEGDITAGRTELNSRAIQVILNDPMVANLFNSFTSHDIRAHNWVLKRVYEYGVVLSIPMIVLYLKMLISICKKVLRNFYDSFHLIGYTMVLSLFIISLAEPNMPFSPGTAMTTAYFFWGYSYQRLTYDKHKITEYE